MHFAFLGTSAAVRSLCRDTTSLLFVGERESALVNPECHDEIEALADEARKRFEGSVEVPREIVPYPL